MLTSTEVIGQQQELLEINRRNLMHYLKQKAMLGNAYVAPGVVHGIYEARVNIHCIKQTLREMAVPVEDFPDDQDSEGAGEEKHSMDALPVDRQRLYEIIQQSFSDDELRELVFALGFDYENLPGQTKSSKARELVLYCERRSMTPRLMYEICRARPHIVL